MKKVLSLLLAVALLLGMAISPGAALATDADDIDLSEFVELTMYLIGTPGRDYYEVMDAVNERLKEDINAKVNVEFVSWADFGTKYPLMLASFEPIDLIYAASWCGYYSNAAKGAFLPLDDLAPKYMPKTYAEMDPDFKKQATTNGHLFGIPASYYMYFTMGYIARGDLMKEFGMTELTNFDQVAEYFDNVIASYPELDPSGFMQTQDSFNDYFQATRGLWQLMYPFYIDLNADTPTIVNVMEDEETLAYFKLMKEWSDKGYWPKSVLSNPDEQMFRDGKAAMRLHDLGNWRSYYLLRPEWEPYFWTDRPYSFKTLAMQDGMAVPAASRNPERALMFLELLHQDQFYNRMFTYGIEGRHFEMNPDDTVRALDPDGFTPEGYCSWGFKSFKFYRDMEGWPPALKDVNDYLASISIETPYIMFFPDWEPIKNEQAAVSNARQQYVIPLGYGYVDDVEAGFNEAAAQLKAAGADVILAELQRQVEEFIATY